MTKLKTKKKLFFYFYFLNNNAQKVKLFGMPEIEQISVHNNNNNNNSENLRFLRQPQNP